MRRSSPNTWRVFVVTAFIAVSWPVGAQSPRANGAQNRVPKVPPLSYVCPMAADADVLESKAGKCPKCGMALQPIRLDLRFTCPVHPTYIQENPGTHPVDGRVLVPVTLAVSWACGETAFSEPGTCPDGQQRTVRYEQRPHGDHNPKHGGLFFMAPDAWHHLEGTYPRTGIFRLYFYNDYSKPLSPAGFSATVSVLDERDQEVARNLPLARGRIGNVMEARLPLDRSQLPVRLLARVTFDRGTASVFNFQFADLTKEPLSRPTSSPSPVSAGSAASSRLSNAGVAATPTSADASPSSATATPQQAAAAQSPPPAMPSGVPAALVAALDEATLPRSVPGLLAELTKHAGEVEQLVGEGRLVDAWLPAMATKTVALALASHTATLPARDQTIAMTAIRRIVMSAWDLDTYGDVGNKPKMEAAYTRLASAITDLKEMLRAH